MFIIGAIEHVVFEDSTRYLDGWDYAGYACSAGTRTIIKILREICRGERSDQSSSKRYRGVSSVNASFLNASFCQSWFEVYM